MTRLHRSGQHDPQYPTVVCLHFLGGSQRTWDAVAARTSLNLSTIDLPGFGDAAEAYGCDVAGMADHVMAAIAGLSVPWLLAGHSMGAKVATVLARRAEDGAPALRGLTGLVLVAGSPPCPEPMAESRREAMLGWFQDDPGTSRQQAEAFIAANVAAPLPQALADQAVADVMRMNPSAWAAWLRHGSREDWSDRIGVLQTPALILAGSEDADLGPAAQRALMAPHFARADLMVVPAARHLLPIEQPDPVTRLLEAHATASR